MYESHIRRSPRFNVTTPESQQQQLALTLHDELHDIPQPLNVQRPISTTPKTKSKLLLLTSSAVRRSPRLMASSNSECISSTLWYSTPKPATCSGSRTVDLTLSSDTVVGGKRKLGALTLHDELHDIPQPLNLHRPINPTPKTKSKLLLLTSSAVRRSPRLMASSNSECISSLWYSTPKPATCSGSRTVDLTLSSDTVVGGKRKMGAAWLSNTKKMKSEFENKGGKEEGVDLKLGKDKVLRRSPRFTPKLLLLTGNQEDQVSRSQNKLGKETDGLLLLSVKVEDKVVRRSSKSGNKPPFKMIKSVGSQGYSGIRSPTLTMPVRLVEFQEDKVLRRSPRALPTSFPVDDECDEDESGFSLKKKKTKKKAPKEEPKERREPSKVSGRRVDCFFVGDPVLEEEAHKTWGWRYQFKNRRNNSRSFTRNDNEEDEPMLEVKCHRTQAQIKGIIFHLGDCALIRGEGGQKHIGRIVEFFQTMEGEEYFRAQWFYKPEDTVMKEEAAFHNKKRIFYSSVMNDNLLACVISKLKVIQVSAQLKLNSSSLAQSDFYYDMEYCLDYSTFRNLPIESSIEGCILPSPGCTESIVSLTSSPVAENTSICALYNTELTMLDLYAGCGAMSTGLCIGARLSGVNLVTRWAIDADSSACESLKLNHSEIQVKNETADDFLKLLKQWESLCKKFVIEETQKSFPSPQEGSNLAEGCIDAQPDSGCEADELEVSSLVDICYGETDGSGKEGLKFKVRWKGFGPSEDTWEPIEGLSNCQDLIQEFVINGFKNKILPLPGDVDVICGGPPCQGISGYNRFRSVDAPLADERNRQLVVFMDIVEYLKPKFVLMENVMDILKFDKGSLGRYALSRLVHMNYQARVGIIAAGCYGLPQFRLRVFFWGALPSEELPPFPLPTHDVVVRYWPPSEFERNVVAYDEGAQHPEQEDAVFLSDAISDLPRVTNYECLDEMPYSRPPETEFQKYIRSTKHDMICSASKAEEALLYDHRPHQLFEDDYIRVCQIPRRKGANFRDLPGVVVEDDNVVRRDPTLEPVILPSGRPLVPEYAFTFEQGKSKRPFARLWWDETMPTIVTYPNCHSQAVLHPEQDRVLTVRECARLQGFPDNYRFCGTVKKRYRQVGNAVAIPVAKALGYALGIASQRRIGKEHILTLPPKFAYSNHI